MQLRSNEMSSWLENIIISSFAALESVPAPRVPVRRLFQSVNLMGSVGLRFCAVQHTQCAFHHARDLKNLPLP